MITSQVTTQMVCLAAAAAAAGVAVAVAVSAWVATLLGRWDGQVAAQARRRRQWAVDLSGAAVLLAVTALVAGVVA